jgi:hypothetical protein
VISCIYDIYTYIHTSQVVELAKDWVGQETAIEIEGGWEYVGGCMSESKNLCHAGSI